MKIYYPKNHYKEKNRGRLFPLLKAFIKPDDFTDLERLKIYGISEKEYHFSNTIKDCDIVILTMSWNHYVETRTENLAMTLIGEAEYHKKKVWISMLDDFGLKFPHQDHCIIYRLSGYRSKLGGNHSAIPAFISDPLKEMYRREYIYHRPYSLKPIVGFCGLANDNFIHVSKEYLKIAYRNLKCNLGLSNVEKELLIPPSLLRAQLLKKIAENDQIETNFLIRKKYRGGTSNKAKNEPTRIDFFENIKDSDYVLCVKGAGNFSVRFYETLAMGRIPIFINTDCLLPLEGIINWKEHVVWIEYNEINNLEDKIIDFHKRLNANSIKTLFENNRELWKNKLKLNSFFENEINNFN